MMTNLSKVMTGDNYFYSKQEKWELWACLTIEAVVIQLRVQVQQDKTKTFGSQINSVKCQHKSIDHKRIFQQINRNQFSTSHFSQGILILNKIVISGTSNNTKVQINLKSINGVPLDNWLIMQTLQSIKMGQNNKIDLSRTKQQQQGTNRQCAELQVQPIVHQNQNYTFQAELDLTERSIITQLCIQTLGNQKNKNKKFKSQLREKDWDTDYKQKFKNIQTLFQHLRNQRNYQVIVSKGLIKIKNQPLHCLTMLSRRNSQQFGSTENATLKTRQRTKTGYNKTINEKLKQQKAQWQQKRFQKECNQIYQKLEEKLIQALKQNQKYIKNIEKFTIKKQCEQIYQKSQAKLLLKLKEIQKMHEIKTDTFQKELLNQNNSALKKEMDRVKQQFLQLVDQHKNEQNIANMKKSHFIVARSNALNQSRIFSKKDRVQKFEQRKFLIDTKSTEASKFTIQDSIIATYKGSWQWTQLLTNIEIQYGKTFDVSFQILNSTYSAIAIGITAVSNAKQRSSLTKQNSISYWGDGEVWEKAKLKQEGQGFSSGDIVTMTIDRAQGNVSWSVGQIMRAQHYSDLLKNKTANLFVYFEMYDEGDRIKLMSCQVR